MKFLVIILLVALTLYTNTSDTYALDSTAAKYLPLQIGNVWVYSGYSATIICHGSFWYDRYIITGIVQINGKTYFQVGHTRVFLAGDCGCSTRLFENNMPIRVDSANQNIYKNGNCGSDTEILVDSLNSKLEDTSYSCSQQIYCDDTSDFEIFGSVKRSKNFKLGFSSESVVMQRYVKDIGLVSYWYYCGGTFNIGLKGCVIDGVLRGDTSMIVGISQTGTEVPHDYYLSQNYPNPFNPTTQIGLLISD